MVQGGDNRLLARLQGVFLFGIGTDHFSLQGLAVCIVLFFESGNQLTLEKCLKKILGLVEGLVLVLQGLLHFNQAVEVRFVHLVQGGNNLVQGGNNRLLMRL